MDLSKNGGSKISIHALRGEGDEDCYTDKEKRRYFNPRPPWGGRLFSVLVGISAY